jgi:hypothetical protein
MLQLHNFCGVELPCVRVSTGKQRLYVNYARFAALFGIEKKVKVLQDVVRRYTTAGDKPLSRIHARDLGGAADVKVYGKAAASDDRRDWWVTWESLAFILIVSGVALACMKLRATRAGMTALQSAILDVGVLPLFTGGQVSSVGTPATGASAPTPVAVGSTRRRASTTATPKRHGKGKLKRRRQSLSLGGDGGGGSGGGGGGGPLSHGRTARSMDTQRRTRASSDVAGALATSFLDLSGAARPRMHGGGAQKRSGSAPRTSLVRGVMGADDVGKVAVLAVRVPAPLLLPMMSPLWRPAAAPINPVSLNSFAIPPQTHPCDTHSRPPRAKHKLLPHGWLGGCQRLCFCP